MPIPSPCSVRITCEQNGTSGLAIRTFRPHAAAIAIVERPTGRVIPMRRLHPEGLFEAWVEGATRDGFDYRYRVRSRDGRETELDDPYRYGPVLTDFDQHLFAEGTHVRAFNRLGARPIRTACKRVCILRCGHRARSA